MTRARDILALIFAMSFPAFMGWIYFIVVPGQGASTAAGTEGANLWLTTAFGLGKTIQFTFPLVYVFCFERSRLWPTGPTRRGLGEGLAFGLGTALAIVVLYFFVLKDSDVFRQTGEKAHDWLKQNHVNSLG